MGNLRVAFRDSLGIAKITQANSYGIWGEDLTTLSYSKQSWKADNFKFTGKESLQGTGFIDFGARWYDNFVPRFTTIDPLSELSRRFSPFVYANGNPLRFIDPDGMMASEAGEPWYKEFEFDAVVGVFHQQHWRKHLVVQSINTPKFNFNPSKGR